jgi:hypothetical protein
MDFLGPKKRESRGIVDILAVRKNAKLPQTPGLKKFDLFDIQIIQVKGGKAPLPTADEVARLRIVQQQYNATRVVLFQWMKEESTSFFYLEDDGTWTPASAKALFGKKS